MSRLCDDRACSEEPRDLCESVDLSKVQIGYLKRTRVPSPQGNVNRYCRWGQAHFGRLLVPWYGYLLQVDPAADTFMKRLVRDHVRLDEQRVTCAAGMIARRARPAPSHKPTHRGENDTHQNSGTAPARSLARSLSLSLDCALDPQLDALARRARRATHTLGVSRGGRKRSFYMTRVFDERGGVLVSAAISKFPSSERTGSPGSLSLFYKRNSRARV